MNLQVMSSSRSSTCVKLPYIRYYQPHYITQMRHRQGVSRTSRHDPRVRSQPLRSGCASRYYHWRHNPNGTSRNAYLLQGG